MFVSCSLSVFRPDSADIGRTLDSGLALRYAIALHTSPPTDFTGFLILAADTIFEKTFIYVRCPRSHVPIIYNHTNPRYLYRCIIYAVLLGLDGLEIHGQ